MEKNDIQSGGAGPRPQAVVWQVDLQRGSPCPATYSKASAALKANSGTAEGKRRRISGLDVTRRSGSHLLSTLNLQLRKCLIRVLNVTSRGPNCALFHPWLPPVNYLELSFHAEPGVN